jgi:hypothetical protein
MKKLIKKTALFLTLTAAAVLTSCSGVIFDTIREEVKLADSQISGTVYSIVRLREDDKEYLLTSLGTIWRKNITEAAANGTDTDTDGDGISTSDSGHWSKFTSPAKNIRTMASNSDGELYVLAQTITEVEDDGELVVSGWAMYYYKDGSWNPVQKDGSDFSFYSTSTSEIVMVFGTNSPNNANRHAFANIKGTLYELSGGEAIVYTDSNSGINFNTTDIDNSTNISASAVSAAYLNGTVYFSNNYGMTTNESVNREADTIYVSDGDYIYYNTGSGWTAGDKNSDYSSALALGYAEGTGLLMGTSNGLIIATLTLDDDSDIYIPDGGTGNLPSNTSSTLSSYYEVHNLLVIDPSKPLSSGSGTDIYASVDFTGTSSSSSAVFQNVGMWAYYPGRNKWNRE